MRCKSTMCNLALLCNIWCGCHGKSGFGSACAHLFLEKIKLVCRIRRVMFLTSFVSARQVYKKHDKHTVGGICLCVRGYSVENDQVYGFNSVVVPASHSVGSFGWLRERVSACT